MWANCVRGYAHRLHTSRRPTCYVGLRTIYVTVNVYNQGICIFPDFFRDCVYSLIHSGNIHIP